MVRKRNFYLLPKRHIITTNDPAIAQANKLCTLRAVATISFFATIPKKKINFDQNDVSIALSIESKSKRQISVRVHTICD